MAKYSLQQLSDRAEISDVLNNYGMAIDFKDYDLLRTCFVDDVEVDFTSLGEGLTFNDGDVWTAKIRELTEGLDATQHIITNHDHKLDGDRSVSVSFVQAQHILYTDEGRLNYIVAGYYNYDFVRTPEGWKIEKYKITMTWDDGDPSIFEKGALRLRKVG